MSATTEIERLRVLLVETRAMRAAQKKYFESRTVEALQASKALERSVDKMIREHDEAEKSTQGRLF